MKDSEQFAQKLGNRIKEIRLMKNVSLEVLALDSQLDKSIIENIEAGSKDSYIDDLISIVQGLNIEIKDLFSDKPFTF